jgi:hypothetical protein
MVDLHINLRAVGLDIHLRAVGLDINLRAVGWIKMVIFSMKRSIKYGESI